MKEELCARKAARAGVETLQVTSGALKPNDIEELKGIIDIVEIASSKGGFY